MSRPCVRNLPSRSRWEDSLSFKKARDGERVLVKNDRNLRLILANHTAFKGMFWYNSVSGRHMVDKAMAGRIAPPSAFIGGVLTDSMAYPVMDALHELGYGDFSRSCVIDAMAGAAEARPEDRLKKYINGLRWDGISRSHKWLSIYCGAEDNKTNNAIGEMWLVSAIARALDPGCRADHALILKGEQGAGKSRLVQTLAGDDLYAQLTDMKSKDALQTLVGKWMIEIGELSAMYRSEVEATKNFITTRVDTYRPPYERRARDIPRCCVFVGTTNDDQFLSDATGNRRFWPVVVGSIDYQAITKDRDQLIAEAAELYRLGQEWWPSTPELRDALALNAVDFEIEDPWLDAITAYCDGKDEVSLLQALKELDLTPGQVGTFHTKRAAKIVKSLGYRRAKRGGLSVWVKESDESKQEELDL
jgi:predicted P-loop ATPase